MREKICEYKLINRRLKIIVWNCQTMNKIQYDKKRIKIQHMIRLINNYFPDIIYLIDTNRQINLGGNYDSHYDGRNLLFTRRDIEMNIKVGENMNWFEIDNLKLGFIYITPNTYDKKIVEKKLAFWNLNRYTYFGDFNIRTNKELEGVIKWNGGETTLQTGVAGKAEMVKLFPSPSDHNAVLVIIKRQIKASTMLDISIVKQKFKKVIEGYLEGELKIEQIAKPKYKLIRARASESEENTVMFRILRAFHKGNVRDLYNRVGWYWRSSRKEPFLGKKIPTKVLHSFKDEMCHKADKMYFTLDENNCPDTFNEFQLEQWKKTDFKGNITNFKIDLKGMKGSFSKAVTMENIELRKIISHMKVVIKKWMMDDQQWKVQKILSNLIKDYNKYIQKGYNVYNMTFFLKKNKSLNSYRDVRMITVCPTLLKIYEALIYDTVLPDIMEVVKKDDYQFGAFPNSSTYDCLNVLRSKVLRYGAKGIVSLDITKGYERIVYKNLNKAIDMIESQTTKRLLEIWSTFVWNTDYMINGQIVKTTRGIPMGLALSPLIFVLYLHCALRDCDKEMIVAYMDDISILMLGDEQSDKNIENILKALTNFGLDINDRKSFIFTDGEWFEKERKNNFRIGDKGFLEVKSVAMMLGRELSWVDNLLTGDNCNFIMEHKIPKIIPNWMTLAMRRLIYIGGLTGKSRYISYMWAFKRLDVKQKILRNAYNFFNINFERLNYVQLFLILPNVLREFFDPFDFIELGRNIKPLIDQIVITHEVPPDADLIREKVLMIKNDDNLKNTFRPIFDRLIELFNIGMTQFDIDPYGSDREENFFLRFIYDLYNFPDDPKLIWNRSKEILNELWMLFLLIKVEEWSENHDNGDRRYIDVLDNTIMREQTFRTFKSLKKFAILLDLLFSRIAWDDFSDWSFFIFDMFEKIGTLCEEGDITEEKLFEVKRRIFAINDPDELEERRYNKAKEVLEALSGIEREFFGFPLHRFKPYKGEIDYEEKLELHESWISSKSILRKYRKILFVLDSMYAQKRNYRNMTYPELIANFQLKYWMCHDSYDELEKVHLIQDFEDYDPGPEDDEASDQGEDLSDEESL